MRIIAGRWRGRRLKAPRGRVVRPTSDRVRESWMAALGPDLEGAAVLDLFAGSGALGFEALSRRAERVVFVERARDALKAIRDNAELLGAASEVEIWSGDAMEYVKPLGGWILRPRPCRSAVRDGVCSALDRGLRGGSVCVPALG